MNEFNYQLVFKFSEDEFCDCPSRIIFTGVTTLKPGDLVHYCEQMLSLDSFSKVSLIENFVYQPVTQEKGDEK